MALRWVERETYQVLSLAFYFCLSVPLLLFSSAFCVFIALSVLVCLAAINAKSH